MQVEIRGTSYVGLSEIAEQLAISRQTIWRWRQEGKIPKGHRYRNRWVVFSPQEVESIREYTHRLEPIETEDRGQLKFFDGKGA